MKFAFISDPHIVHYTPRGRLDDAGEASFRKFEFVLRYCSKRWIPLFVAGDLTNVPRSWHILPRLTSLLRDVMTIHAVYGQHDSYMRASRDSTIMGSLARAGLVRLLSENAVRFPIDDYTREVSFYGCSYGDNIPVPIMKKSGKFLNVLVIHTPISSRKLNFKTTSAMEFLAQYNNYDLIVCGDIHIPFFRQIGKRRTILNTGPMMRLEASEEMFKHEPHFWVWKTDDNTFERVVIPHRPADEVLTRDRIEGDGRMRDMMDDFLRGLEEKEFTRHEGGNIVERFMAYAVEHMIETAAREVAVQFLSEAMEEVDDG